MHTPTTKNVIFKPISPKRDKVMITLTILPIHCINLIASNGFYSLSLSHTHTIYLHCGILLKHGIFSGVFWDTYLSCVLVEKNHFTLTGLVSSLISPSILIWVCVCLLCIRFKVEQFKIKNKKILFQWMLTLVKSLNSIKVSKNAS